MLATATVVEIQNHVTRQHCKLIVPAVRGELLPSLLRAFAGTAPAAPVEACLVLDAEAESAPSTLRETADAAPAPDGDRLGEALAEAFPDQMQSPIELIENLAVNLCRLIDRYRTPLDTLAEAAGIDFGTLEDILAKETEATLLEILRLAEFFGTTASALIARPKDERASEWN